MNAIDNIVTSIKKKWPDKLNNSITPRMMLLGAIGVALLIFGGLVDGVQQPNKTKVDLQNEQLEKGVSAINRSYEEVLEAKLANLLSQIKGAGSVTVSIILENGSVQEHAKNMMRENKTIQEKDTSGGIRTTTEMKESEQVLLVKENGLDRPVVVREFKPIIKGVLVIADGANDSIVKANLTKAVETGLGIAPYKITVLPQRR